MIVFCLSCDTRFQLTTASVCTLCGSTDTVSEEEVIRVIHKAWPKMCEKVNSGQSDEVTEEDYYFPNAGMLTDGEVRILRSGFRACKKNVGDAENSG